MRRADLVTSPEASILVRGFTEGSTVVLSVYDPFLYSNERAFFSHSTGIELILAQHSIQRLGGQLRIESAPTHGTSVFCVLPGRQHGIQWLNDTQIRYELEAAFGL